MNYLTIKKVFYCKQMFYLAFKLLYLLWKHSRSMPFACIPCPSFPSHKVGRYYMQTRHRGGFQQQRQRWQSKNCPLQHFLILL